MMNTIFKSLTFWTLVAGLLAFVAKFFLPTFPLDNVQILAAVLFLLGLFGVTPAFRAQGAMTAGIASSLAFWQLIAGLLIFVAKFLAPAFPFDVNTLMTIILFVLGWFQITPELRARGILPNG
jgi:hypothetical protein